MKNYINWKDQMKMADAEFNEGKSRTPKYVVDMKLFRAGARATPSEWRKEYGKPTDKNLAAYMEKYNKSLEKGGANEHLGQSSMGTSAVIRENKSGGATIAKWKMKNPPKFVVD